jgi:sphingomyelin phosphodiesterase acid-like 3
MPGWRRWCCGIVCVLLIHAGPRAAAPATESRASCAFVALSDLHFNPFFDPSLASALIGADPGRWQAIFESSNVTSAGTYGQDSSYPLLRSALAAAAGFAPDPDFVLITGDFFAHGFQATFAKASPGSGQAAYRSFVLKTVAFVTAMIHRPWPRARTIAALGNNDSDCGDYQLEPGGPFLAGLGRLWQPLLGADTGSFPQTFPAGGYFSVPHPTVPHLQVVVLNTVAFSPKYKDCGQGGDRGSRQLLWLQSTLQAARQRGDKVWLVYHIPPGIDAFATLHEPGPCASAVVTLWRPGELTRFRGILAGFPGLVTAAFAGHTHMDEFRLPGDGFVHQTPAVSPVFGNNPGFAVFSYLPATGELDDVRTYYLDLAAKGGAPAAWALEYDFRQSYGQPAVDAPALHALQTAIGSDPKVRDRYMTFHPVSSANRTTELAHWKSYWCATQAFTAEDFTACYCPSQPSR